jgi:hypothetical protein
MMAQFEYTEDVKKCRLAYTGALRIGGNMTEGGNQRYPVPIVCTAKHTSRDAGFEQRCP